MNANDQAEYIDLESKIAKAEAKVAADTASDQAQEQYLRREGVPEIEVARVTGAAKEKLKSDRGALARMQARSAELEATGTPAGPQGGAFVRANMTTHAPGIPEPAPGPANPYGQPVAMAADNAAGDALVPQPSVSGALAPDLNPHADEAVERARETVVPNPAYYRKHRSRRLPEYRLRDSDDADTGENLPVVNKSYDREAYIRAGWPAWFDIKDDTKDSGDAPWYAIDAFGVSAVNEFDHLIEAEAIKAGVNPNFVRAIVFIENSHGYYDVLADKPDTIRPMNINPEKWGSLGLTRESARDPETNIRAGVQLLKEIWDRVDDPTPRKVAALWQFIGAEHTDNADLRNYVARVERLMKDKPWQRPGPMNDPSAMP